MSIKLVTDQHANTIQQPLWLNYPGKNSILLVFPNAFSKAIIYKKNKLAWQKTLNKIKNPNKHKNRNGFGKSIKIWFVNIIKITLSKTIWKRIRWNKEEKC